MSLVVMIRTVSGDVIVASDKRGCISDEEDKPTGIRDDVVKLIPYGDGVVGMVNEADMCMAAVRSLPTPVDDRSHLQLGNGLREFLAQHYEDPMEWPKCRLILVRREIAYELATYDPQKKKVALSSHPTALPVIAIGKHATADMLNQWFVDGLPTTEEAKRIAALMINRTNAIDHTVGPTMDMWIIEPTGPPRQLHDEAKRLTEWARTFVISMATALRTGP